MGEGASLLGAKLDCVVWGQVKHQGKSLLHLYLAHEVCFDLSSKAAS